MYSTLQVSPRHTFFHIFDLLRRPTRNNPAALFSAARAHVDDVVGIFNHIQVVFDDKDGGSVFNQRLEYTEENLDIRRVKTDRRLIEDEDRVPSRLRVSVAGPRRRRDSGSPRPESSSQVLNPLIHTVSGRQSSYPCNSPAPY